MLFICNRCRSWQTTCDSMSRLVNCNACYHFNQRISHLVSDDWGATEGKHKIGQVPVHGKVIRPSNRQAPRDSLLQELHEVCKSVLVCYCRTTGGQEQPPSTSAKGQGSVIPWVIRHTCWGFVLNVWVLTLYHCGLCYCVQGTKECQPTKCFQLVFESPVLGLAKDCNQTGLRPNKTKTEKDRLLVFCSLGLGLFILEKSKRLKKTSLNQSFLGPIMYILTTILGLFLFILSYFFGIYSYRFSLTREYSTCHPEMWISPSFLG